MHGAVSVARSIESNNRRKGESKVVTGDEFDLSQSFEVRSKQLAERNLVVIVGDDQRVARNQTSACFIQSDEAGDVVDPVLDLPIVHESDNGVRRLRDQNR